MTSNVVQLRDYSEAVITPTSTSTTQTISGNISGAFNKSRQ